MILHPAAAARLKTGNTPHHGGAIVSAPLLSIVIVNYNGLRFLDECLLSLARHVRCAHEVILVDNASTDGSAAFVRERYPEVTLVETGANLGFTGGNNLGARAARGELLLLLNNDTQMLGDPEPALVQARDPAVGAVGCRLVYGDRRQQLSVGLEHTPLRMSLAWVGLAKIPAAPSIFRLHESDEAFYRSAHRSVSWVSGAFMVTRRAVWERLGGFDERYFMYVEDVDYCKRVRALGLRVAYVSEPCVVHYEGAGRAWVGARALLRTLRSYLIFTDKFYGRSRVLPLGIALAAVMLMRAAAFCLKWLVGHESVHAEKARGAFSAAFAVGRASLAATVHGRFD